MCLALPARIISIEADGLAVVALEGIKKSISLALVEDVTVGDYVLVHVGYALHKVSEEEAVRTLAMMAEAGVLSEQLEEIEGAEA
ncbi:MAG: HypC/HybG/HupF family hydrogenase formation chaperone [Hyphomicrobiaceae bacterium]|nr:HypC/HybG/HupF family hydrogenase formation chaperone [Hyphomicrobiaceae bacterium]MCC0009663.1 HypC/HybG/HupF family hydrogenase formation chaperone [Hyphomicrobiaceae bacterium]